MRLLSLTLVTAVLSLGYTACSDDDYGHSQVSDGGTDGGSEDASAAVDLSEHD